MCEAAFLSPAEPQTANSRRALLAATNPAMKLWGSAIDRDLGFGVAFLNPTEMPQGFLGGTSLNKQGFGGRSDPS